MAYISRENLKAILIDFKTKVLEKDTITLENAKAYADSIKSLGFAVRKVDVLPQPEDAKENIFYLVPKTDNAEEPNLCDEYVFQDGAFELVGNTSIASNIDTSNFYTKTEIDDMMKEMTVEEINQFNTDLWG